MLLSLPTVWLFKRNSPGFDRAVLALARSMDISTQFAAAPKHRRYTRAGLLA